MLEKRIPDESVVTLSGSGAERRMGVKYGSDILLIDKVERKGREMGGTYWLHPIDPSVMRPWDPIVAERNGDPAHTEASQILSILKDMRRTMPNGYEVKFSSGYRP
ncbi:hypothetical protein GOV09_07040 [Candidatus Woesearchaeota archaeon]|nr:hypothetical protein [Candidatus Woesearchaeota archaeon]